MSFGQPEILTIAHMFLTVKQSFGRCCGRPLLHFPEGPIWVPVWQYGTKPKNHHTMYCFWTLIPWWHSNWTLWGSSCTPWWFPSMVWELPPLWNVKDPFCGCPQNKSAGIWGLYWGPWFLEASICKDAAAPVFRGWILLGTRASCSLLSQHDIWGVKDFLWFPVGQFCNASLSLDLAKQLTPPSHFCTVTCTWNPRSTWNHGPKPSKRARPKGSLYS